MLILVLTSILWCCVLGEVTQSEDGKSGTISFSPPTLNDEEAHSKHIPTHLKCDACTVIAYKIRKAFDKEHAKRKSVKQLPESDIIRIVEEVCWDKFEQYGIKEVNKIKRLSGPGLETEEVPGVMQGGGKWPERLSRFCHSYNEELEDTNIYTHYLQNKKDLTSFMCRNNQKPGMTDVCGKQTRPYLKPQKKGKKDKDEL